MSDVDDWEMPSIKSEIIHMINLLKSKFEISKEW